MIILSLKMKTPLILILSLALSFAANGAVTILEDNWDDIGAGAQAGLGTGNNAAKTDPLADPTGSGRGNVGAVDIGRLKADGSGPIGTSPWGELIAPWPCLLYTSPSPRDGLLSRMPSSA